ncbi:unnamed protein product [Thlaspi arvense]|uniref:Receptor ligand binding region domain-containing protein n=1 Tax=Thlaspi arvense TaxID=13288 RepID=A0AAU9SCE0_THLAR|nr:unnamed protein product [Thlaspi arvense]
MHTGQQIPSTDHHILCNKPSSDIHFVRATVNDSSHVNAIAAIVKYIRWRSVVAIHADNELGEGIMPYLFDALQGVEVNKSVINPKAYDDHIRIELLKLMMRQTRVFVVHMDSSLGLRVFQIAKEIGMMDEGYVWLLSNEMTPLMRHSLETMQGVLGVRSRVLIKSKEHEDFRLRWENPLMEGNVELNVFSLWAYDSITALAMAVENSTRSLTSESSTFEIINVLEDEERIIGFWTPSNGLVNANSDTSISGKKLGPVIWPGKPTVTPKRWEFPTKKGKKKLIVGVPVKGGFPDFVHIKTDPITNKPTSAAALEKLDYPVIPEYIVHESRDVIYDDLVQEVYKGIRMVPLVKWCFLYQNSNLCTESVGLLEYQYCRDGD